MRGFFAFSLSLHDPNNCLEYVSSFLFAHFQLSSQENLFLGGKNIGGVFVPHAAS